MLWKLMFREGYLGTFGWPNYLWIMRWQLDVNLWRTPHRTPLRLKFHDWLQRITVRHTNCRNRFKFPMRFTFGVSMEIDLRFPQHKDTLLHKLTRWPLKWNTDIQSCRSVDESNFTSVFFKVILRIYILSTSCEVGIKDKCHRTILMISQWWLR